MSSANLEDIKRFVGGTHSFSFKDVACRGVVQNAEYIPIGPGVVKLTLVSLQPVVEGPVVPDVPLEFLISCFLAKVEDKGRELIINCLVPDNDFGPVFSFRTKD